MSRARVMLVPETWGGSVEHYYHFLLGYLVPVVAWQARHPGTPVTVRSCGPLNAWWDLLGEDSDIEVVPAGTMLQRVAGRHQRMRLMRPLDNPRLLTDADIEHARARITRLAGVPRARAAGGILVIDRAPGHRFYSGDDPEVPTAGSERRSVPNMGEIVEALGGLGEVRVVDAAALTPREQVEAAAAATVLVGQHGAGLANALWLPPGAGVVEILPPMGSSVRDLFGYLARRQGLGYRAVPQADHHSAIDPEVVLTAAREVRAGAGRPVGRGAGPALERARTMAKVRIVRRPTVRWAVRLVKR
jgi:hypothetical protein